MDIGEGISGAAFSDDQTNRFSLWRIWDTSKPCFLFAGLNPSKAGHKRNDPTAIRMIGFGKAWGFGGVFFANLSSQITPYPDELIMESDDPCQEAIFAINDVAIKQMREICPVAMVGWGEFGKRFPTRVTAVLDLIGEPVYCIKVNQSGEPTHPLYLPGNSKLQRYYRKGVNRE